MMFEKNLKAILPTVEKLEADLRMNYKINGEA